VTSARRPTVHTRRGLARGPIDRRGVVVASASSPGGILAPHGAPPKPRQPGARGAPTLAGAGVRGGVGRRRRRRGKGRRRGRRRGGVGRCLPHGGVEGRPRAAAAAVAHQRRRVLKSSHAGGEARLTPTQACIIPTQACVNLTQALVDRTQARAQVARARRRA
jgi:hypothetical protein